MKLADRPQVAHSLRSVNLTNEAAWLPAGNPYSADAGEKIKSDGKLVSSQDAPAFIQYLASSVFVHNGDAWSFFGRAIDALVHGDLPTAVHLTYYAELRAALSLLASEGIFVGNSANFVVTNAAEVKLIHKAGTHDAAWQCLEAWNEGDRSGDLLSQILKPANQPFNAWVDSMPAGGVRPVIESLLNQMKFDLQHFASDRSRRNAASYHPSRISVDDLDVAQACALVDDLWAVLEPDSVGAFTRMDEELVWRILAETYTGRSGKAAAGPGWESWLEGSIPASQLNTALHERMKAGDRSPLEAVFHNDLDEKAASKFVSNMMFRTVVLLRLSTGSARLLLAEAGLSTAMVERWATSLSEAKGLWAPGDRPTTPLDLWADTRDALDALAFADSTSPYSLLHTAGRDLPILGQTERIVAWSY